MTNDELIKRLEAATGPDRDLDAHIARHVGFVFHTNLNCWLPPRGFSTSFGLLHFTSSIDSALTLVPEGWTQGRLAWPGYDHGILKGTARAEIHHEMSSGGGPKRIAFGASLPIALCIAALKARSHQRPEPSRPGEVNPPTLSSIGEKE